MSQVQGTSAASGSRTKPPFRADHVGSLLRPAAAAAARATTSQRAASTPPSCARIEDEAIREIVRKQEEVGLQSATDGEFRRASWHMDFIYQLDGITKEAGHIAVKFHNERRRDRVHAGGAARRRQARRLEDDLRRRLPLPPGRRSTTNVPKLTIPSPSMVHYRGGKAAIDPRVYPDLDAFWADLTAAYREQVRRLGELGCTYLQFDDTSLAYMNDPHQREYIASIGGDAERQHVEYIRHINEALAEPARRDERHDAHVPRQLPLVVGGRGRAATSSPRRSSTSSRSTASSWSGTTSARAASSRCASCRRARSRSCSGS